MSNVRTAAKRKDDPHRRRGTAIRVAILGHKITGAARPRTLDKDLF